MPIFEYRCPQCHTVTETIRKIADKDKPIWCPRCDVKSNPVPISKPAPFRWGKGGGWN